MPDSGFVERLNEQIANEFAAHQQYVANAIHYDGETLPRLAAFFYAQAVEERNHAMMMVQYLLDADAAVRVPGIDPPRTDFVDLAEPVRIALDQERRVSDQVAELAKLARDGGDLPSEQFMQWFLKEQVEEVATMSALLKVVERSTDRPMDVEEYLVRERPSQEPDPIAPPAAGGAL
jgi:bacterioferritin B